MPCCAVWRHFRLQFCLQRVVKHLTPPCHPAAASVCLSVSSRTPSKKWLELFGLYYTPWHLPSYKSYFTPHSQVFPPLWSDCRGQWLGSYDFGPTSTFWPLLCRRVCCLLCTVIGLSKLRSWPSWIRVGSSGIAFNCSFVLSVSLQVPGGVWASVGPIHTW